MPDNIRQPCPWSSLLMEADVYSPSVLYVSVTAALIWQKGASDMMMRPSQKLLERLLW